MPDDIAGHVLDRLIQALAAQLDPTHPVLTPGAVEALTELSRAEAGVLFGNAGHLVHYGDAGTAVEALIRLISEVQRREAPAEAGIRPGDKVRLVGELPSDLAGYDETLTRDTVFVVRYVGEDTTLDVQPELTVDYVIEAVPAGIVEPA